MSTPTPYDKFTGKHTTLDIKMPDLEEPEENIYADPVRDRFYCFSCIHAILLTSLSPLCLIFGIRKRRLRPLKQLPSQLNHHCPKWLQLQRKVLYLAAAPHLGSS